MFGCGRFLHPRANTDDNSSNVYSVPVYMIHSGCYLGLFHFPRVLCSSQEPNLCVAVPPRGIKWRIPTLIHSFKSLKFCAMLCGIVSPSCTKQLWQKWLKWQKMAEMWTHRQHTLPSSTSQCSVCNLEKKETNITRIMWITCIKILVLWESIWEKHSTAVPMFSFVVLRE